MHVPDDTRADEALKAELEPREAGNRAWNILAMLTDPPPGRGETPGKHPGPPLYVLHRFECPRSVLEDDYLHDRDDFVHTESHRTLDIAEALEKAAEYEPDWSKWGTRKSPQIAPSLTLEERNPACTCPTSSSTCCTDAGLVTTTAHRLSGA